MFDSDTPDPDTYIGSIDLASGIEQWRVPFPYNVIDLVRIPPFFQLNAAGTMLFAQHLLVTDTELRVEMWGLAVQKSAGTVVWKVSHCFNDAASAAAMDLSLPGGLLFPGAASDGDDIVLLLSGSLLMLANGSLTDVLPWTSIKASTGEVLYESVVHLVPMPCLSSLQLNGRFFSVQGINVTADVSDWSSITAVFSMSDAGVFALQSSRMYDIEHLLQAVTTGDTLMQAFLYANHTVSSWVGWSVPEQQQRWQRSDDALLMWQYPWPTSFTITVWLQVEAHPLNSSWVVASTLGADQADGNTWPLIAIYDTRTGDRIATSAILPPQQSDDEGDVYIRPARLLHTDRGARLVQTLQGAVYVLDVNTLQLLYSGTTAEMDVVPLILRMEGAVVSRLLIGSDSFGVSAMTRNASSCVIAA